ncbi:MAG: TRAP transporter fused permease subunit, partial [Clostridium sp.]
METTTEKKLTYGQFIKYFIVAISLLAVFLHVGNYTIFGMQSVKFYAWHVMVGVSLIYLYYPLENMVKKDNLKIVCRIIDWICMLALIVISFYVILNFENYMQMMQNNMPTSVLYCFGLIMTVIILEAGRRALGIILPAIAIITVLYALFGANFPGLFGHRGYTLQRVVSTVFGDQGIYGTATATCASNVYLFLLFAAYLGVSGADKIFQDIAIALAGKKRGGPAKMAIVASAFFGTISGSCVANVVSTGAFTIPLMKRNGYKPAFAGAVEAVSSTGGQIMPPIMGAAAFVLADVAGIPYARVCLAAFLPAVMYYCCEFKMVDLEAVKHNLQGLDPADIPDLKSAMLRGFKLFLPVFVLLFMMLGVGATPMKSAIWATASIIILGLLDKKDRMTGKDIVAGATACGKTLCSVIA